MPAPTAKLALTMSGTDWLLLVVLSVFWGGSFYFAKIAVVEIPPMTLAFGRVGIAAAALVVVACALGLAWPRDSRSWLTLVVMGIFNSALPFTLWFWGQLHIPVGLASILMGVGPVFGVVIAHTFTHDDKLNTGRVIGVLAGFVGLAVLIGVDFLKQFGTHVLAEFACVAAAISYAFGAVYSRRLRALSPLILAAGQLVVSTLVLLPLVMLFDRPGTLVTASWPAIWSLLALSLVCSALGYMIYFRVLGRAGATNAMLVTFLTPVSAIVLGIVLLDENLEIHHIIGMLAIFVSIAAIDGRPARWLKQILQH